MLSREFEDGTWQVCYYTHNLYKDANKFSCTVVYNNIFNSENEKKICENE